MTPLLARLREQVEHLVDPHRQERVEREAAALVSKLLAQRGTFELSAAGQALHVAGRELGEVAEAVYRKLLLKIWADYEFTAGEKRGLGWAGGKLQLSPERQRVLQWEVACQVFERCLQAAIEHEAADPADIAHLGHIAECLGWEVPDLVHRYFLDQGEHLVAALFESLAAHGDLALAQWERVLKLTSWLGLSKRELRTAVGPRVKQLLERVLANCRTDHQVGRQSETALDRIAELVGIPPIVRRYVTDELTLLRVLSAIERGELPLVEPVPGINLERGEKTHFHQRMNFRHLQHAGMRSPEVTQIGSGVLTNKRLIVKTPIKVIAVHHEFAVALRHVSQGIEVITPRGVDLYDFGYHNRLAMALYSALAKTDPQPRPQISPEERDTAWFRDEGRCALCKHELHLEFVRLSRRADHCGPVHVLCHTCALKQASRGIADGPEPGDNEATAAHSIVA